MYTRRFLEGNARLLKDVEDGWVDNYSDFSFKNSKEAVDFAFSQAYDNMWGKKVVDLIKNDSKFQKDFTSLIQKLIKEFNQI